MIQEKGGNMAKNRLGVDWEEELPREVFDYLKRCGVKISAFEEEQVSKMIVNGLRQNEDRDK